MVVVSVDSLEGEFLKPDVMFFSVRHSDNGSWKLTGKDIKKVCPCKCTSDFQFSLYVSDYSATTVLSVAVVSAAAASAAAASTAAIESAIRIESALACSALAALLPQDAKDTATIAAAIKTNFFISFTF